ncbi:MAG TPA: lysylphosphatidylglycerol synthase transmembrane domain-containing protein [Baekduia sp.]|uniref:lysylphosphatidylglycerol synthase transmembrane domain-containing protein n=1 Tax=Baekduia sp. TaxID=2600305 RepID=UPI002C4EF385|nr:lysylphosphatidylglycerol synthase transmembrane domain-containing protein [Baekduia sp.]HMJ35450.1 lysylphosphatidylglycerol synthase transmembrane domain-containing protein [Baekduia sp.]
MIGPDRSARTELPRPERDDPRAREPAGRPPHDDEDIDDDEEMPLVRMTRRTVVFGGLFVVLCIVFLTAVLPQLAGLGDTWKQVREGDPLWLLVAGLFTALSFAGYVLLFQGVYVRDGFRLTAFESYQITMAGLAATRVFAAGGAGGIALTAWALRRAGMPKRAVADQTLAFLVLTYGVYMAAVVIGGFGLYFGILPGSQDWAITLLPAIIGIVAFALALLASLTPTDLQKRLDGYAQRHGRWAQVAQKAANLPAAISSGIRISVQHVRSGDPALAGSIAYWGFNIAILWASFKAFGEAPPWAVIVMGYFVGMLANLLPLPGGVGGVDGGMIGAFVAFGGESRDSIVVAVLTYRLFAFYLPTIPGAVAYFQLRRTVARWKEERAARRAAVQAAHG